MKAAVKLVDDQGRSFQVPIAPGDLVAELKELYIARVPSRHGKLLGLFLRGVELQDHKAVGEYPLTREGHLSLVEVPRQPFSPVDYARVVRDLQKEGYPLCKVSDLPFNKDLWDGTWTRGEEWATYPPVDVSNIWSSVAPSSSRELAKKDPGHLTPASPRLNGGSDANGNSRRSRAASGVGGNSPRGGGDVVPRGFQSYFTCQVNGYEFSLLHKLEGKWNGEGRVLPLVDSYRGRYTSTTTGSNDGDETERKTSSSSRVPSTDGKKSKKHKHSEVSSEREFVTSSKLVYDGAIGAWIEEQHVTTQEGFSTTHRMRFHPHANGELVVDTDQAAMSDCVVRLSELKGNVLVLTAVNQKTGYPVMTETLTCTPDFRTRSRTTQRFGANGELTAVYVQTERKIIDQETGALSPYRGPQQQPTNA